MTDRGPLRCAVVGLGAIGREVALTARAQGHDLVAAVDPGLDLAGRDLGDLLGVETLGVTVTPEFGGEQVDVAFHATRSSLAAIADDLAGYLHQGVNVVSSCEELFYPWRSSPQLASGLHEAATSGSATLLGTGVNPGFVMDTAALAASVACSEVRSVTVWRHFDPTTRRLAFQRKVGLGLSLDAFHEGRERGTIGHVGLVESAWLLCDCLGLGGDAVSEALEPLTATALVEWPGGRIEPGAVAGLKQTVQISGAAGVVVDLELEVLAGSESSDRILLDGNPPIEVVFPAGIPGDQGTASVIVNAARRVVAAGPGLVTMADIALPHAYNVNRVAPERERQVA
jgi:4-hydroxy-tetrahydrodipicolinate reductase